MYITTELYFASLNIVNNFEYFDIIENQHRHQIIEQRQNKRTKNVYIREGNKTVNNRKLNSKISTEEHIYKSNTYIRASTTKKKKALLDIIFIERRTKEFKVKIVKRRTEPSKSIPQIRVNNQQKNTECSHISTSLLC